MRDQGFQKVEFAPCQDKRSRSDRGAARRFVKDESAHGDGGTARRCWASQGGADSGDENGLREGLGDVVVGAEGQAVDTVVDGVLGGEEEDRSLVAGLALFSTSSKNLANSPFCCKI